MLVFLLFSAGPDLRCASSANARGRRLAVATAKRGEFLVLRTLPRELVAPVPNSSPRRSMCRSADRLARSATAAPVKKDQAGDPFDPSRVQQDIQENQRRLQQAQSSLDQARRRPGLPTIRTSSIFRTANYNVEKAKLEASKQAIMSKIQGEESEIDLAWRKKSSRCSRPPPYPRERQRIQDRGARTRPRQRANASWNSPNISSR